MELHVLKLARVMIVPQIHLVQIYIVKVAVLRVVLVLDLMLVQQQQIEHVQFVMQDQHGKMQHHIHLPRANLVRHVLLVPQ
jgi:hypothetical protein